MKLGREAIVACWKGTFMESLLGVSLISVFIKEKRKALAQALAEADASPHRFHSNSKPSGFRFTGCPHWKTNTLKMIQL